MNNEEEIMMKNKIEKREKMDTILAYILIVILLGSILLIIYLKFIKKEEVDTDIHTTKYATINDVVKYLNDSELGVSASTSNNAIVVTSTEDGDSFNLNIPLINNELEIKYNKENEDIVTDIYKEIISDLCVFYGNNKDLCVSTSNNITKDSNVNGIRFIEDGDNTNVYININSSIDIPNNDVSVYNDETIVDVTFNSYELKMNNVEVSNIMVNLSDTDIIFTGNIKNLSTDKYSLVIKLFNANGESIGQSNNDFSTEDKFDVKFDYNDSIKKEDIKKYSISIKR